MPDLLIAVRDDMAEAFTRPPVVTQNKATALRGFAELVNNPNSDVSKHPEHYSLWIVGTWDAVSGKVEGLAKEFVAHGSDVKEVRNA